MVTLEGNNLLEGTYYYPRPDPGEKIPILVLNFRRLCAAWSLELKKTLYFEKKPDDENLKRVREINLLHVYDWLAGREGVIELTDPEFEQFMEVYEAFLERLGEIQYIRRKKGRRTENIFELKESPYVIREVKKGLFSSNL